MSLSCEELVDEIQSNCGRVGDTILIDDTWATRRLNRAQRHIVDNCPGLPDLQFKNITSLDFATDQIAYDITDITSGDTTDENGAAHIDAVWYLDGADSIPLDYMPVDEFDSELIDPTHTDNSADKPTRWTRRRDTIEVAPRPSADYDGKDMRVDGVRYPAEFSTNDASASEIGDIDEGLIAYVTWKAWQKIGGVEGKLEASRWKKIFSNPDPLLGEDYGWLEGFQSKYGRMDAWDGDLIG